MCLELGIPNLHFMGLPRTIKAAFGAEKGFSKACVDAVNMLSHRDASLLWWATTLPRTFRRAWLSTAGAKLSAKG
jgi:hypothetical protein